MATHQNCWEQTACGREPGGKNERDHGTCPAAIDSTAHALNGGKNGGRICWAVSGTFSGGKVHCTNAERHLTCMACDFFRQVEHEAGERFSLLKPGQSFHPHK
jgi:hypothetical protein